MSDLKLFRLAPNGVSQLSGGAVALEKSLQQAFEQNLEALLGVRFLASEFVTEGGRMDTLGIDENNSPVIVEYKRSTNENVINQGLFYLNWLMSHQADFKWLVMERLGKESRRSGRLVRPQAYLHCRRLHPLRRACGQADEPQHRPYPLPEIRRRIASP